MTLLSEITNAIGGTLIGDDAQFSNVSINSNGECEGRLFVALKGPNFDAHEFVDSAREQGAVAAMVTRNVDTELPIVRVPDTYLGLTHLAAWWRDKFDIPVVGVTGSAGKTTVKEMLGMVFAEFGNGVVTQGNLNNEIGVPLTLMRLTEQDQYAIIEMGMNHSGEIERLSQLVKPQVALINNAAAAHLEGLGSVEAVAYAKGEIFSGLSVEGVAIINSDDRYTDLWRNLASGRRVMTFGLNQDADVRADYSVSNDVVEMQVTAFDETFSLSLAAQGEHNVRNALAAIAVAKTLDLPTENIVTGLEKFRPATGRLEKIALPKMTLFDDSYNANPASVKAALDVLADQSDTTCVLGDMAELGASSQEAHRAVGEYAKQVGIKALWLCGRYANDVAAGFGSEATVFESQEELLAFVRAWEPHGAVLVKGSRSAQMERVVNVLQVQAGGS